MALIDDLRKQNPKLRNLSDRQIASSLRRHPDFQGMDEAEFSAQVLGAQPEPQQQEDSTPGFMGGLAAGVDQLQGMGGGLLMAAGEAMESQGVLDTGRDIYQRNMEEAAENDLGYGFTDIRGPGDAWNWAKYTAGNLLPMMAASVAGGGVGGIAAGTGARMLAGAAAKEGAKRAGQALGAWAASTGMETGAMMGETEELDVSLAHGALAGSLDALTPVRLLRSAGNRELADKAASEISDRVLGDLRRQAGRTTGQAMRRGSLTNMLAEMGTEGLQGLINQHANYWVENNGDSLLANLDEVDVKAIIDEAAAGGLMGGLAGGPAGIGERGQARRQVEVIDAAREQAAARGGDALDQTMAAQEAEQTAPDDTPQVDPAVASDLGNRLQMAMGGLDELQSLARGSSFEGATRLRNVNRLLDNAEQAFESGEYDRAERLLQRADGIAGNLRQNLEREGSNERPAQREGELVDDTVRGYIGQDSRRLPPGDPSTIYGEGPTADQTQTDPQARTVRRDEAMAAQRQGEQRMREQASQDRPQLTDAGIVYGQGPVAGNANTGLDQPFDRAAFTDTGAGTDVVAARARQQQNADDVARLARTRGRGETAYLPDNTPVRTRFRVMDAAELRPSNTPDGRVNPDYPQELQPRDRTNANSQVQVRNIAARLNPERLGSSRDAGTGAPIVGNDGVVESGNGRTMAIAQAYQQGGDRARAYRDFVRREAEAQGIDPSAVDEMAQPVLVRERVSNIDRADFARRANESQVAGMTAYEQAQADADSLTADDLQAWSPDQGGDPLAASNRDFQRAFVQRLGNNEAARYTTRGGQASPELGQRMQRAVFAKAYQDADMVEMATEQGDQMRNLTAALQVAAPDLAIARETGSQDALDAIGTINDAARIVRQSRQDGISVRELTRQADAFSDPVPETTALLAVAMHNNLRSRRALSEGMRYIGQAVRTRAEDERNGALFEDTTTNEDVFNAAFQEDSAQRAEQRPPEGVVQPGAERGQRQPAEGRQAETAAGAQAGQQADAVDAPWAMTRQEWEARRNAARPENTQTDLTSRSASEATARMRDVERLTYGVLDDASQEFNDPDTSVERRRELYDQLQNPVTHRDVVAKALREGQPVPQRVIDEYPDLPADNDPLLATYDEQELAERDQAQQQAEQADADRRRQEEQRAQADAEADDFRLAGSDRPADVMAAGGQQDLMGAQPQQSDANAAPEGFEPYRTNVRGMGEMWAVPEQSGRQQSGDSLFETLEEALTEARRNARRAEQQAQMQEESAASQRREDEQQAREQEEIGELADTLGATRLGAGKARDVLNRRMRFDGQVMTRKERIERAVEEGATIQGEGSDRRLMVEDGAFYQQSTLTKTGMDYAEALIQQREGERASTAIADPATTQQFNFSAVVRDAKGNPYHVNTRRGTSANLAPFVDGRPEIHSDNPTVELSGYTFADEWWDGEQITQGRPEADAESPQNADASPAESRPTQQRSRRSDDRIEDFGERIAGARKDQVNQVMAGLETEVTGTTTLSEAFPAPNYSKLIEEGVDPRAAAFVAVIRNSIPAKPRKSLRLKMWMRDVEQAQSLARMLLDGSRTFDDFLAEAQTPRGRQLFQKVEGALRTAELIAPLKPSLYSKAAKWRVDAGAGYSLYDGQKMDPNQTVYVLRDERGRRTGVWSTDFEAIRDQAANVITSAVQKDDSKPKSRQTPINVYRNTRTGDRFIAFQVGSRKIRLVGGFESASAAADYITENRDQLQQQIDAMRAGPRMRNDSNAPREGVELRDGDVTPDDFQAAFGFRGVQFGNYVEGQRRQADLNQAYDALMDLATMLGVPPKAMSLDGTLGLAFGARGKGGRRSAAAHYEPGQVVINLTKNAGPGSLAHEWFHALDNFIPHERSGSDTFQTDLTTQGAARAELAERWREMRQALKDSGFEARSKEFDKARSKAYFGTPIEMAARAFERYTKGKLEEQGIRNDYLVNISSDPEGPYPTDAEMDAIAPAFDRMMGTLEHRETPRGVELYSLNPDSEALKPAPRAEDIAAALEGIEELGDARVIQTVRELPPQALLGMAIRGVNPRDVRGMYIDGELYVIADNVDSVQEGVRTAVHEAVGHKGMRAVLGADLERAMLSLYRNLPNSKAGREALAEVRRDYPFLDPSKREDRITIGEEMVAHLLEKGHRPKAWQRAVAKIRELLRRLFPSVAWTYTDALALGEKSRDYLRRQQAERQGDAGELYSLRGKQRAAFENQFDDFTDADRAAAAKIGSRTPPQRAMEWFKEKADRAGLKIRQGMVDRVAALKEIDERLYGESALGENITRSSWVLARMSNAANGALHALLHNGRIKLDAKERVITLQDGDAKGLGEVLGRLGSAAEIERFMGWIAGNRAARLEKEGRENLFNLQDIEAMKTWNRGTMADGRDRGATYQEIFGEFQTYRDDVLAVAEQSGIISKEQREMWAEEFYVPFYRLAEDSNGQVSGMMATSGLSRQQAYKRLKGGTQNLNDLLQNTMMNMHHLLDASLKNQAAVQAVENAKQLGMVEKVSESTPSKSKTFVMEGGQKVFYEIDDPLVFQALTALAHPGMNSTAMKVMRGFKRVFTNLTTTTPQFMVANLIRDSLQATATNNVSKNAFKNVIDGAGAYRDQRIRAQMLASGASFNFGHLYGNNPDELRSQLTRNMRDAQLVDGPYMVPNVLRAGWAWWNDVNNAAENVNRAAIYAQNRESGELRAAFESRDLIDFSAHGAWPAVRVLIDIVPFLNARIQGLDKIYRSGVKPGASVVAEAFGKGKANTTDKQAAARFWTVTGALAAATIALYLHNQDDEEYQKLEDWQKDTYWFFRAGDQAFFIPKPFEVGAIATMAERITEQFTDDQATGKLFRQRMMHMMTDTFSFSPVPQAVQPALDIYANYDAFTQRPIESMGMERLSPELRRRANTSKAGEWISAALNSTVGAIGNPETNPLALSPVQVDHLIGGYLGQVGTWAASSGDVAWRVATGKEEPARRWYEYQPVRRFYKNLGDEDRYTKYGTIFYEGLREAERANADVKELREMGRLADAAERAESNRDMLALRLPLQRAQRKLGRINKQIDIIRRSSLDGEIKRQRIDRLTAVKNQIQRALGQRIQEVRSR